ncbi:hypothetical protein C0J52_06256 [Blattella germanica]|nr:hypothetical protein C0J52_06256 [Blattella germanica]
MVSRGEKSSGFSKSPTSDKLKVLLPDFEFTVPPEAPVFEPTVDEFQDPLGYIRKIRPFAEQSGICKIKPPPNWQPPFAVDVDRCGFQSSVMDESVNGSDDASDYVPDLIQLGQVGNVAVEVSAIDEEIPCFNENWDIIPKMNPEPDSDKKECEKEEENIEPIPLNEALGSIKMHRALVHELGNQTLLDLLAAVEKEYENCIAKTRIKLNFLDQIAKFWELQGSSLKIPMVERRALDLYTLHRLVQEEGGVEVTTRERKWTRVSARMGFPPGRGIGTLLKNHYDRILYPFDVFQQGKLIANIKIEPEGEEYEKRDQDYKPHGILARQGIKPPQEKYSRRSKRYGPGECSELEALVCDYLLPLEINRILH